MTALDVQNLVVRYGNIPAISDVNLKVEQGERLFISGPNGAGKSTLLKAISGAVESQQGQIRLDDFNITNSAPEAIARLGVTMVPEGRNIFGAMSVEENLQVGVGVRSSNTEVTEDLDLMYNMFPILFERRSSLAGAMSGGQQQMLAIARGMMTNPSLMLVDEPSLGLAPNIIEKVYEILCELQRKRDLTLVIVEQSSVRAARVGGRMILLRGGRIIGEGDSAEFAEGDLIKDAYFGDQAGESHR